MSKDTLRDTPRQLGTELMQDLSAKLKALAVEFGMPDRKAHDFAQEAAGQVADDWGGQLIYVPMELVGRNSMRNARMYAEFTGDNHGQLASRYGLSVQAVYRIIKAQRVLRLPKQASLLDDGNDDDA